MKTAEDHAYRDHLNACEAAERGDWCQECRDLIWDADVADWRPTTRKAA